MVESLGSEDGVELDSPGVSVIGEDYEGLEVCAPSGVSNWESGGNIGRKYTGRSIWCKYWVENMVKICCRTC